MIYLYDEDQTDFRYNGRPLPKAYEVRVRNFINEEFYVTLKHPIDNKEVYKEIKEDLIIKAHTPNGMQPFRLLEPHKEGSYVEFEAWPLLFADMRNKSVKPLELNRVSLQVALNAFKDNLLLDTPFEFYTNISDLRDYHTQDADEKENNPNQLYDALEILKDIINRWQGELDIDGYSIRVTERIGADKEALIYEKKNINEFVEERSIKNVVTRVHGKSDWTERSDSGGEDIKHSIQATVDSPLIGAYSGGIIFEKQFTNNDIRTQKEMEDWLRLKFETENIDKPSRSIELDTNIIDSEEIHNGDGVILKYLKHDVDTQMRMNGYEYDGFENRYLKTFLGDVKGTFTMTVDAENENTFDELRKIVQIVQAAANGKNRIFRGSEEPTTGIRSGDLWYKPIGDGEVEMHQFNGTIWELVVSTVVNNEIERRLEEAMEAAENARQRADSAYGRVKTAIDDAEEAYKYADSAIRAANGKNTVYRGNEKPTDGRPNDIWFEYLVEDGEPVTRMHIHDANDWQLRANDASMLGGTLDLAELNVINLNMDSATGGSLRLDRGIKVENNGKDILRVENGNVTMDVDNLMIESSIGGEGFDEQVRTAIYQDNQAIGLIYEEEGQTKSLIHVGPDGPYLAGENIVLDGDTIVDGTFTVTDEIFAEEMNISKFTTGTLNAADVNIINLNVDNLVGNTSNFVQSAWNSVDSTLNIDATNGVRSIGTSSGQTEEFSLTNGRMELRSNAQGYDTRVRLDGVGLRFTTDGRSARMRYNGTNIVMDNGSLGMNNNHINSVDWIRMIGKDDYETNIQKHPTASGGAIVDSSMLTIGLGIRNSFSSIAQFYGQIDFRRDLHMLGNDIRSVNRLALENSNSHFLSHPSTSTAGGALVDSTRLTLGIGSPTSFNDRITVTNSQIDLRAHTNLRGHRIDQVSRLQLVDTSGYFMHLSSGAAVVDSRMVTIAMGSPTSVDRIADFYGRIDFYKNLNMNGNAINNQSDGRYKTIKKHVTEDILGMYKALDFVKFEYIEDNMPEGEHFGLVAQDAGKLGYYDDFSEKWLINSSDQIMYNSLAVKQLADELDKLKEKSGGLQ